MLGKSIRTTLAALALAAVCTAGANATSVEKYQNLDDGTILSANQWVTMEPLIVPMIENGEHRNQFSLGIALELVDEGDRDSIRWMIAKIRSQMYDVLFRLVSHRTAKPRIPHDSILIDRLYSVAKRVAGVERVKSLIIRQAQVTAVR